MKPASSREERQRPDLIPLSKRAEVIYLEHARVMQRDGRVVYLSAKGEDLTTGDFHNVPFRNVAFVMLGKGTSITDSAARLLAESGVLVAFTGSGGSPLFSAADQVFLSPQSEYRAPEYMQAWVRQWIDDAQRLQLGKELLKRRLQLCEEQWARNAELGARKIVLGDAVISQFARGIESAANTQELLSREAEWVKSLYRLLAIGYRIDDFRRVERVESVVRGVDDVNSKLTHGNYIAYGFAAASLYTLGISFAFPALHGKTRRGGLVFDVADLVKDWTVLPLAFHHAHLRSDERSYRRALIAGMQKSKALDVMIESMKKLCA